ncbi:antichymotrypsin-2-like isoform X1 [Diabrotica virgifera virgifera]|uniref:Antichymotrypsin-2-like isoform X1 n=1 Tax=Diabrotica virgifera virgifera TaxID=50390 RepID=A0A6P7GI55_DIAVI|nr:antichymotrypsin-2-like isoform X1 [Diabrotica virgifera virgifera]
MYFDSQIEKMHKVVFLTIIASFFGCNADNFKSVVRGNFDFTAHTYEELVKISGNNNIIVSGLSAEIVLSLLANGAKGETQKQLLNGLSLPTNIEDVNKAFAEITSHLNTNTPDLKLLSANKIYPRQDFPVEKSFKDIAVNFYSADVQNLDFNDPDKAARTINSWVEQKTNNKIHNIIDPETLKGSILLLVNALYYTGKWDHDFDKFGSADRLFHSSSTESKKIPTMYTESFVKYAYNTKLKAKFLELGFQGGNVSMTFVLPDEINGLAAAEQNLKEYLAPQPMEPELVAITLPKFKIETKINFKSILRSLGITQIFQPSADLSGISKGLLIVGSVLQKAFINVNEDGVEAAAATMASIIPVMARPRPKQTFNADHPFLFYISQNNLLLFVGRFMQ